ncbi:ribosome maturation factor RimP [Catenulispora rubra]|uniref:ribosome maturation factor RimP n=1 Tax=Catenulispora rubra TaxID=280293 RepID=UPI00189284CC|nr:ribosome maturation factor RimP [Catenulispora rubra]
MSTPRTGAPADRLQALLEPVVAAAGYDLETVRVSQVARRRRVEVVVDGDDGVSLDAVSDLTRVVSDVLDGPDGAVVVGDQPYVLEVGSPGTDRPLTLPKHWRRAKGRLVRAVLTDGGELTGRVLDGDEDGVLLEVEVPGKKKGQPSTTQERRLAFAEVAKARVEIEFNRKDDEADEADETDETDDIEDIDEDEEG